MKTLMWIFAAVLFAAILVAAGVWHGLKMRVEGPVEIHVHHWSKWSEPKVMSNWWEGTRFTQTRTCETCGLAESRRQAVSAQGETNTK